MADLMGTANRTHINKVKCVLSVNLNTEVTQFSYMYNNVISWNCREKYILWSVAVNITGLYKPDSEK